MPRKGIQRLQSMEDVNDNHLVEPSACSGLAARTGSWLDTAAECLGLEVIELLDGFQRGLTLAEMACARDVDVVELEDAILDALDTHVADLVENRGVDEHDADEMRQRFEDIVASVIEVGWRSPPFAGGAM